MSHRIAQINELLRHEVGQLLLTEVDFPAGCLVTITSVTTSKDLRHATLWISVIPGTLTGKALERIKKNIGAIQHSLNKRLHLKPLPRIKFKVDEIEQEAQKMEELLNTIEHEIPDEEE